MKHNSLNWMHIIQFIYFNAYDRIQCINCNTLHIMGRIQHIEHNARNTMPRIQCLDNTMHRLQFI